jgi:hypothetical protein
MGVTKLQFSTLEELFDFYNKNLFDNEVLITIGRKVAVSNERNSLMKLVYDVKN